MNTALELEWYDFVCFGIVGLAFLGAIWVLWMHEGASQSKLGTLEENLLVGLQDSTGVVVNVVLRDRVIGQVRSTPQLWTSCWRGLHPLFLLITRFLSFVVMAVLLPLDVREYDASIFVYYTEWTFTLVMIYFALGTIISAHGCWQYINKPPLQNGEMAEFLRRDLEESTNSIAYREKETKSSIRLQSQYIQEEFNQRVGFWGYLMQITYQTSAGAIILTDIVFWCVIVPFLSISHFQLNMLMVSMHSLNAVFLLLDTALNNLPFPWFRLSYFVLWSCGYIIFQWVIHACGFTWWPYPFLELNTPWAPVWYLCLAVIHIPLYGMYSLIVKAKNTILPRFFPRAFLRTY
ncbi:uncharacterized protein LOC114370301 isoform X1 [Glycine soja]|uniref:Protein rolling stone n=2 Tax=Glycine soja TaxID=3848 RepID=A0A445IGN7_GLYSO|nr:uncharacterized protein LOC114370301 isoform X1 [Glycine soja]RZB85099.1 hypothetical protein D0Y65_025648 [Glycine soja]